MELDRFLAVFDRLHREQISYILAGSFANAVQGRIDGDDRIDLFIEPDAISLLRVHHVLRAIWPDVEYEATAFGTAFHCWTRDTPIFFVVDVRTLANIQSELFVVQNIPIRVAALHGMRSPVTPVRCGAFTPFERFVAASSLAACLAGPRHAPRGVRKFRSWSAAQADRERTEAERILRVRAERLRK